MAQKPVCFKSWRQTLPNLQRHNGDRLVALFLLLLSGVVNRDHRRLGMQLYQELHFEIPASQQCSWSVMGVGLVIV